MFKGSAFNPQHTEFFKPHLCTPSHPEKKEKQFVTTALPFLPHLLSQQI